MPTFIHVATGKRVSADGPKADQLDRLTSWERAGSGPVPEDGQDADPVWVGDQDEIVDMPPKAGPGSSRDAWVTFAAARGVPVDESWSRDDIIAAVEQPSDA